MKATSILANARKEITDFIKFEIPLLYKKIYGRDKEEDEEYSISTCDLKKKIFITIDVDNSYLDVDDTCYEKREIAEIVLDSELGLITLVNEDGEEWDSDYISLNELAAISNAIEEAYIAK